MELQRKLLQGVEDQLAPAAIGGLLWNVNDLTLLLGCMFLFFIACLSCGPYATNCRARGCSGIRQQAFQGQRYCYDSDDVVSQDNQPRVRRRTFEMLSWISPTVVWIHGFRFELGVA